MENDEGLQACKLSVKDMLRGYRENLTEAERRLDAAQTVNEALQVLSWLTNSMLRGPIGIQGSNPTKRN